MGFDKLYSRSSGSTIDTANNDSGINVVTEEPNFQGSSAITLVKQEICELEDIIMEGDIILNVHTDAEEVAQKSQEVMSEECVQHSDLFLHQDKMLLKVGDSFKSHQDFVQYVNENAKRWKFFYKCTETTAPDTENESYTYCCVYLRNRDYKKKVIKKRYNGKTDCPCKIKLSRSPGENLTVMEVCNHHDHDLSREDFYKLQNSKKLSPYIKEMIMDLIALEVQISKIRKFVEIEMGVRMGRTFFYDIERKMRLKNEERHISDKRLKELSDKLSVVDEMYSDEDENSDDQIKKSKRSKLSAASSSKNVIHMEDVVSVQNLEASMNSDSNSWIKDQSVPPGTSQSSASGWQSSVSKQGTMENDTQQDTEGFIDADDTADHYTEYAELEEQVDETETVESTQNQQNVEEYETLVFQDEHGNIINPDNNEQIVILQQDENGLVQGENGTIGYFDGDQFIYMGDGSEVEGSACDATVQTSSKPDESKAGHSYVPVFDVYMKNGNVTGFVVDDDVVKDSAKPSKEPEIKTVEPNENSIQPICDISTSKATHEYMCGDIYTKHEYIHRYNIDEYMANPNFPKYIDTLAKKTHTDVMHMLARVYSEKAMFKMTTTQKGKEGNTKIWYLTDVRRKGKYKMSDEEKMKRDKIGQYITDILILKEKVKCLKKENEELITRNKYLEEVALRLAKQ